MDTADVLVVGAGPAGLQAAITLGSEGKSVILLERQAVAGGQAGTTSAIENLLPFPNGLTGADLTIGACAQSRKFGVQIDYNTSVESIIPNCDSYTLLTNHGYFHGRVIVLAMGLASKPLEVPGADLPGIHLGMNMNALEEVGGRRVVLIGGGNSAGQAACFYLSKSAQVTLLVRKPIKQTMSAYLVERLVSNTNIVLDAVTSFERVNDQVCIHLSQSDVSILCDCVHVFIGQRPATEWLSDYIQLDSGGYIVTDERYQTNRPGIFAVGDVTHDAVRRVGCAVGDGSRVAPIIHQHLDGDFFACYLDV